MRHRGGHSNLLPGARVGGGRPSGRMAGMAKQRLPPLPDTGRRYLDNTVRARLQGPAIERYRPPRGRGRTIAIAALLLGLLLAALVWLALDGRWPTAP